ncbi:MAG: NAD(P)/FAD-dependent oxidoreductase [Pyrinomonadaceae bacterium]|nr:NAD(P)/FAD-dependent oxidoreductase [Pyrinomonadaceae bacterium]
MTYDAIIIGGGAAGLFCAITAGKRGRKVLVIEHNAEVGRKIVISGGGRCNFTNLNVTAEHFISQNPHFCRSALAGYTPRDFIELVKKHRIPFYEKKLGQLFCRESSRAIVEMLLTECRRARVEIRTLCTVTEVGRGDEFSVETSHGRFTARNLVIACGGLSFPKIGATDLGYRLARQFGLKVVQTRPSLVGLVLEGRKYAELAGVSLDCIVSSGRQSFRENVLFTHRGLSGPAIIQISNYWKLHEDVSIDLLPEVDVAAALLANRSGRRTLANVLAELTPKRLAEAFASNVNKSLSELSNREIDEIGRLFNSWQARFSDTEGYSRAEVTLGGISTAELSSKTMEAKKVSGLYFIGELVDVTGWLGGYNFQWAWSSGFTAGNAL